MDWVALMAALPAIIAGLGDHLPGLLVAAAVLYLYVQREREYKEEQKKQLAECQECERAQRALADKAVIAIEGVSARLAAYERGLEIAEQLAELGATRKVREDHANANRPGQN